MSKDTEEAKSSMCSWSREPCIWTGVRNIGEWRGSWEENLCLNSPSYKVGLYSFTFVRTGIGK